MRIPLALLALLAAGCGQNSVDSGSAGLPTYTNPGTSAPAVNATPSASGVNVPMNLNSLKAVGQPLSGKVNPEHGKPGHRCDIAVGAPLPLENTASSQPAATTLPASLPVTPDVPSTTAEQATAPGMNPPHGKPGHRCDIAVGAPLNAKPVTTAPVSPDVTRLATPTDNTVVKPGTNPPHGKPGHRCDIAVGAPLNSKPAISSSAPVEVRSGSKDSSGFR
jgi:hypothetical protein